MSTEVPSEEVPPGLRQAVRAYARRLEALLGEHIGVITDSTEWISRTVSQPVNLTAEELKQQMIGVPGETPFAPPEPPPPPVTDPELLQEWRDEGYEKPLLIVAPAGTGKSCLLETFALQMAKDLLDETRWSETEPLPDAVPILISLAKMGEIPLSEYLYRAEADLLPGQEFRLSKELIAYLRSRQRLVLLIDGFDEAPSAHKDLVKQIGIWKVRFALTSRPG